MYAFSNMYTAVATFAFLFLGLAVTQYWNYSRGYVEDGSRVTVEDQQKALEWYIREVKARIVED